MIAVLTTRARGAYLPATLDQIDGQRGLHSRHVFFDGPTGGFERAGWEVHELRKETRGNAAAFWQVLRYALSTGESLIFFEDDVRLTGNVVPYLEAFPVPRDLAFVTFLSSWTAQGCPWGLYRAHGSTFFLAQCLKANHDGLAAMLEARARPTTPHSDSQLGHAASAAGMLWGAHVPDLVQHIGAESVANPGQPLDGSRIGRTYPGDGFDAVAQLKSAHATGIYT